MRVASPPFRENPAGFARVVRRASLRARTNALGLLCRMVTDGDHRLQALSRGAGRCVVCDAWDEDALKFGGQFYCHEHELEA